jgi:hypothetical protein
VLTKQDDTTANHGTSAQLFSLLFFFYQDSEPGVAPTISRYVWIARVQLFFFALVPATA